MAPPTGLVNNGEVEDYHWNLPLPTAVTLVSFTATGTGGGILVAWETTSEVDNLGFYLYRSDALVGTRTQLNDVMITSKVHPGSPEGASYTYTDRSAVPGTAYYCWLEAIDVHGATTLFGPVRTMSILYLPVIQRAH